MEHIPAGTERIIDGRRRVHYDGYWIKVYDAPEGTLAQKKRLIEALTRRLFNHAEHGINFPGERLPVARAAFEAEQDPDLKRVKGAMLAGALFNRATEIFTKVVEMQELGVQVDVDNALLQECGNHLREAFALGKMVRHVSGEEGIDELWGEPLKAFTYPVSEFYRSRYIKIAQTMTAIDRICGGVGEVLAGFTPFQGIDHLLQGFAGAAKDKCETLRTDPDIFDVWPRFVVASEQLERFEPRLSPSASERTERTVDQARRFVDAARALLWSITRARVPMPKSTAELLAKGATLQAEIAALSAPGGSEGREAMDCSADRYIAH